MEIRIDPEKDSVESIRQVQKILRLKTRERENTVQQGETNVQKPKKAENKLTEAEKFLTGKYEYFILKAINEMANRTILNSLEFADADTQTRMRILEQTKEELIVDDASLFRQFIIAAKHRIHVPDPYLFKVSLDKLKDKSHFDAVCTCSIETIEINGKKLMKVVF